jgi:RNAse (barnase) inhibitor barstar
MNLAASPFNDRDTFGAMLPIHFASAADAAKLTPTGATRGPITSADVLFSKLAQALELPDYFGHNWDALDECLREVVSDVLLLVNDAETLWREAPDVALALVDLWLAAAEEHPAKLELVFVWS